MAFAKENAILWAMSSLSEDADNLTVATHAMAALVQLRGQQLCEAEVSPVHLSNA